MNFVYKKLSKEFCGSVLPKNNANEEKYKVDPYKEFVSEALAEYFISESPSKIAIKIGKRMEELYANIA